MVAKVDQYSTFLPWCKSSRVLSHTLDGSGAGELQTEIGVGFDSGLATLQSTFSSLVTVDPLKRVRAVSDPNEFIEHLSFTWDFAPLGDRSCRIDVQLELELKSAEHALIWEFAQDKVISKYIKCFTTRCGEVVAARGNP